MNLNGIKLKLVDVITIFPIYTESVSESAVRRRVKLLKIGEGLSNYPIVERDNYEDKYWLVSGFLEYISYKQCAYQNQNNMVPVLEQPYSDTTTQRIKLLRSMFQDPSNWLDRHCLINQLMEQGYEIKDIAKKIGVSSSCLKHYMVNNELPNTIVEKAYKNNGSFINLEQIRRLNLHPFVRDELYERAVLPRNDYHRLTTDKLQKVQWLISLKEFRMLNWQEQLKMIQHACIYKEILVTKWEQDCIYILDKKRNTIDSIFENAAIN